MWTGNSNKPGARESARLVAEKPKYHTIFD